MSRWIGGDTKPNGNDRFTKVLLHLDGNLNDDNAGGSAHTWSKVIASLDPNGTAKFGSGAGQFVTGSSQGYTTPAHSDFDLGSSDFTIDFWYRIGTPLLSAAPLCGQRDSAGTSQAWAISMSPTALSAGVFQGAGFISLSASVASATGVYYHLAFVRSGGTVYLFHNGVLQDSDSITGSVNTSTGGFSVGRNGDVIGGNHFDGQIDEFRLSVGIARWATNFTPPTRAYSRFLGSSS